MKEILEETAHRILTEYGIKSIGQSIGVIKVQELMVEMAKWQVDRMYSEEEVLELIWKYETRQTSMVGYGNVKKWFEQFKKK
jgi:hypothetical protein